MEWELREWNREQEGARKRKEVEETTGMEEEGTSGQSGRIGGGDGVCG